MLKIIYIDRWNYFYFLGYYGFWKVSDIFIFVNSVRNLFFFLIVLVYKLYFKILDVYFSVYLCKVFLVRFLFYVEIFKVIL